MYDVEPPPIPLWFVAIAALVTIGSAVLLALEFAKGL